ncbi:MAG: ABC transporter ATP-binding protein/permease [Lachnospiraceae bacterium]|nr:ABC transporter ATP-binding protein/permease [Lachnospiraceae bacterium]
MLKRFIPYLLRYKRILILDLFCAALTTICDMVLPLIMSYLTTAATDTAVVLTIEIILKLALIYLILRMIDAAANYYMAYNGHVMGVYIETDMRRDAFEHLQRLGYTYYANNKVGQIMGRITNDLFDVTEFAHHCPEEFFIAFIKLVVSFIILCHTNVMLTLIVFACLPVMLLVSFRLNLRQRDAFRKQRYQVGELNAQIEDSLLGERVVKAFTAEALENGKFEEGNQSFQRIKKKTYQYMALFQTSTRLFDGLMYLVVILAGGLFLVSGKIDAGDLVAYMLYVTTLIATIRRIVEFAEQFQRGMTGIERFCEIMDAEIEVTDVEDAVDLSVTEGRIQLEDVSFEYPDDHNQVLRHVNLSIRPGEKLALVGPSGGGKTTLCNLLPRFYDVTEGKIYIDGQDISQVTLKSLREAIGIVQQDVFLFSGSVADNIAYGKPDASREEIMQAARLAGADTFIEELKDGYDTYIGERGVKLSGGQKQRLSIARVFLKNPRILILDEATSALDNESELLVGESLEQLAEGRTTLTIAHRLTTVKHADRILVLGREGIEEEGSHEELLSREGIYYRLWNGLRLS